jgi:hypothetical protein
VDWLLQAKIMEKDAVSIFRTEVKPSVPKMETANFSEMLASTNQSTQQLNPKEHHQKRYTHVLTPEGINGDKFYIFCFEQACQI